jgi:PhoH-like ATPase
MDIYTGFAVVENFQYVDELYKKKELPLSKFKGIKTYPNMCLVIKGGQQSALGIVKGKKVRLVTSGKPISSIKPRNKEQALAVELLRDKDVDLVTMTGCAGSGKTLLALAYAWESLKSGEKNKIVLCKDLVPVGREIGFLKGDLYDKVRPWIGNFYDNFEVLGVPDYEVDDLTIEERRYQKRVPEKVEISPITFIQGRSITNAVIIVDEAQNLSPEVVKQILTRPAENTKIILLGDLSQVFEKGMDTSGLQSVVEAGKECEFIGHIDLIKSERSRLTDWASKNL